MDDTTQSQHSTCVETPRQAIPTSDPPKHSLLSYFRYRPTLPAEEITPRDRHDGMQKVILAWVAGSIFFEGIGGTPFVGMFRMLGATPAWIGLLVALPSLASLATPIGSWIIARTGSRKRFFLRFSYTGRAMWLVVIFAGLILPHGSPATLAFLFGCILFGRLSMALTQPAWWSWVSDLIPAEQLGEYWGRRQMWGRVSGVVGLLILNWFLGTDPTYGRFVFYFTIVSLFGLFDIFIHRGVTGVRVEVNREEPPQFHRLFTEPIRDRRFRPLLIFVGCFAFTNQLGGGMLHLMFLEDFRLTYFEIALYMPGLLGIMWIIGSRFWGRLVDNLHDGRRVVFIVCSVVVATHVLIFVFTGPRQHSLIVAALTLGGLSWSGYHIALTALIIGLSPSHARAQYFAAYAVFFGIGDMLGAISAGQLAELFAGLNYQFGPLHITQFRTPYLISAGLRVACLLILVFVREPDSRPMGVFVRRVFSLNPFHRGTWVYVRSKFNRANSR